MVCSACGGAANVGVRNHNITTCPWKVTKPQCFHLNKFIGRGYITFLGQGGVFPTERSEQEYWRLMRMGQQGDSVDWFQALLQAKEILKELMEPPVALLPIDPIVSIEPANLLAEESIPEAIPQVQEQLLPSHEEIIQNDEQVARNLQAQFDSVARNLHTRVKYINHTREKVHVYWLKRFGSTNYQLMHCCNISRAGTERTGVELNISRKVTNYAIGTRLIMLNEPQGCEGGRNTPRIRNQIVLLNNILKKHIMMRITITEENQVIIINQNMDQWKEAALKMDYLFKEMIKLGANDEKIYANIASIVDLHQDVYIPEHSEQDKEMSGIPSVLTNVAEVSGPMISDNELIVQRQRALQRVRNLAGSDAARRAAIWDIDAVADDGADGGANVDDD
jgi:hypothetical protein